MHAAGALEVCDEEGAEALGNAARLSGGVWNFQRGGCGSRESHLDHGVTAADFRGPDGAGRAFSHGKSGSNSMWLGLRRLWEWAWIVAWRLGL